MAIEPTLVLQRCRTANCPNRQAADKCPQHGGPAISKAEATVIAEQAGEQPTGARKSEAKS
jgi:hypothetical protein